MPKFNINGEPMPRARFASEEKGSPAPRDLGFEPPPLSGLWTDAHPWEVWANRNQQGKPSLTMEFHARYSNPTAAFHTRDFLTKEGLIAVVRAPKVEPIDPDL